MEMVTEFEAHMGSSFGRPHVRRAVLPCPVHQAWLACSTNWSVTTSQLIS